MLNKTAVYVTKNSTIIKKKNCNHKLTEEIQLFFKNTAFHLRENIKNIYLHVPDLYQIHPTWT